MYIVMHIHLSGPNDLYLSGQSACGAYKKNIEALDPIQVYIPNTRYISVYIVGCGDSVVDLVL